MGSQARADAEQNIINQEADDGPPSELPPLPTAPYPPPANRG